MDTSESGKDIWDKAEIVVKGLAAIVVSGIIAFYSIVVQEENRTVQSEQQEANRKAQTLIQLVNSREQSNSNLRGKMFDTLLSNFFNTGSPKSQIVALEMIGLNFRNNLHIKPMFKQLDAQLARAIKDDPDNRQSIELRQDLRKASRVIIRDQLNQIDLAEDGRVCKLKLNLEDKSPKYADCFSSHAFKLIFTSSELIRIQAYGLPDIDLTLSEEELALQPKWGAKGNSFGVSYFDMPMSDYTQLTGGALNYSLVLLNAGNGETELAVAILPLADYSSGNAYRFDHLLDKLLTDNSTAVLN